MNYDIIFTTLLISILIFTVSTMINMFIGDRKRSNMRYNEYIRASDNFLEFAKILESSQEENRKPKEENRRLKKAIGNIDEIQL